VLITFNDEEIDFEHKKTYRENIKIEFEGYAILLKLNKKRKNQKNN